MENHSSLNDWIDSIEYGDAGFTYLRLYVDAPNWVRNMAINHFGKGTVFLPPRKERHTARAA